LGFIEDFVGEKEEGEGLGEIPERERLEKREGFDDREG
jgi:hypothetical protein